MIRYLPPNSIDTNFQIRAVTRLKVTEGECWGLCVTNFAVFIILSLNLGSISTCMAIITVFIAVIKFLCTSFIIVFVMLQGIIKEGIIKEGIIKEGIIKGPTAIILRIQRARKIKQR